MSRWGILYGAKFPWLRGECHLPSDRTNNDQPEPWPQVGRKGDWWLGWGVSSGRFFLEVPDICQHPSLISLLHRSEFPQKYYWWFFQTVPGESPPYSEFLGLAPSSWLWVPTAMRQHSLSSQGGPGSALWSRGLSGAVRASASQSFSWEFG